ncbi:MAG: Asp-tRNA(Asn)/Glu-tRNA(Gln) amidotransferase subunit GatB [Chloroflexota bacterium]|nr:MAG: Asp-tRNA(Asn)/Glu-tRNA(Gln) amidotransferase subunit GatB [Chloroflexota bacterium]
MNGYEPVIGLEIHAELLTNSKMFCGCRVVDSVTASPNTAVCPVCLGMPGMLPVINRRAIELAMRVGLALNCTVQRHNLFARKNYFYPDLPKAYQISQYELPLAIDGWLDLDLSSVKNGTAGEESIRHVRIRRVHLEEDTGKLTHLEEGRGSLVDFNRSGVPLLEIVSEPDLRSVEEARLYAAKIRQILSYLEVNSGNLEKGVIRFEANVSVRPAGSSEFGTRTEIKNLNSFRALTDAIAYEFDRQSAILASGGRIIQDTMGWSENRRQTFSQRGKEEAHDYRYFPEPDLPPLEIDDAWIVEVGRHLPELPDAKLARYVSEFDLTLYEAAVLTEDRPVAEWYESAVDAGGEPKTVANWMINTLFAQMNEHGQSIEQITVEPGMLVALINLVDKAVINANTGKEVLADMFATGRSPQAIVEEKGLAQISDEAQIVDLIDQILADNPDQVAAYLDGADKLRGWFTGQVMRASGGKANPRLVNQLLSRQLAALKADS